MTLIHLKNNSMYSLTLNATTGEFDGFTNLKKFVCCFIRWC